jgi:hypothetical protein
MSDQALVKREQVSSVEYGINTLEIMGKYIAQSGLFGIKSADQAIALMLIAQAEGYHPAMAARDYDIIQGRPALKAKAKLARFQKSGGVIRWIERTETKASATFEHPASPQKITVTWTMKEASVAGLGTKEMWKKYPRQMLSARVISEGVDASYPDAGGLLYVPEEVIDFEPAEEPIPITAIPIKQPDPFEDMVLAKGIGGGMQTYLGEYMKQRAEINKKTVLEIKNKAIKHPSEFWKGFQTWLDTVGQDPDNEAQNAAID